MCSRTAFVATVLITSLPLPIQAHDIYSHLRDEGGGSCCDNQDCRPALTMWRDHSANVSARSQNEAQMSWAKVDVAAKRPM